MDYGLTRSLEMICGSESRERWIGVAHSRNALLVKSFQRADFPCSRTIPINRNFFGGFKTKLDGAREQQNTIKFLLRAADKSLTYNNTREQLEYACKRAMRP